MMKLLKLNQDILCDIIFIHSKIHLHPLCCTNKQIRECHSSFVFIFSFMLSLWSHPHPQEAREAQAVEQMRQSEIAPCDGWRAGLPCRPGHGLLQCIGQDWGDLPDPRQNSYPQQAQIVPLRSTGVAPRKWVPIGCTFFWFLILEIWCPKASDNCAAWRLSSCTSAGRSRVSLQVSSFIWNHFIF